MEIIFFAVFLLGGLWGMGHGAISLTGKLSKNIEITCSHSNAFYNVKYFCKGACTNKDILIRTSNKDSNGKYNITNKGNTFYVNIFNLTKDDSGIYWCGIDRIGFDTYNKVILTVIEDTKKIDTVSTQSTSTEKINENATSSKMLVYVGAGLGVVVLALVLLIFLRHRNRDSITSTADSPIQPDSLFYTTISFNRDAGMRTDTRPAVIYSTIRYKSTDESAESETQY
ncbi:hypothetical protein PAMP_020761 [Pampus punctatissimus]